MGSLHGRKNFQFFVFIVHAAGYVSTKKGIREKLRDPETFQVVLRIITN